MISRRLGAFVLFPLVATFCYSVILSVVALLGATTTSGESADVTVSAAPLSAALHGVLIAGLGTLVGVVAAGGPFLPDRARQVLRGALVAVGSSTLLALVLAMLVLVVTSVPENPLGNLPQDAGPQPGENAQPNGAQPDGGGVGNSIRSLLTAIGGMFALLPASVGTLVLGLFNKPAKRDFVTCGRGFDRVLADTEDLVAPDCEKVAVGLAAERRLLWWRLQRPNISWVAWRSVRDGPH